MDNGYRKLGSADLFTNRRYVCFVHGPMARLRFYQLSLRRLFLLTAIVAAGLWLALWWVGQITPHRGETLVTLREQRVLQAMQVEHGLSFAEPLVFT